MTQVVEQFNHQGSDFSLLRGYVDIIKDFGCPRHKVGHLGLGRRGRGKMRVTANGYGVLFREKCPKVIILIL